MPRIICSGETFGTVASAFPSSRPEKLGNQLSMHVLKRAGTNSLQPFLRQLKSVGLDCEYVMEDFILVYAKEAGARQRILKDFFHELGFDYERIIDTQRNRENIRILLQLLQREIGCLEDRLVFDYGCGTGLSVECCEEFGVRVIGVEIAPSLARIARERGMTVLKPGDLSNPEFSAQFDAAFASYVLHLKPPCQELQRALGSLKGGRPMVGNLHKGRGLSWLEGCFNDSSYELTTVEDKPHPTRMASMSNSRSNTAPQIRFARLDEAGQFLAQQECVEDGQEGIEALARRGILPRFDTPEGTLVLTADLASLVPSLRRPSSESLVAPRGFIEGIPFTLSIGNHTILEIGGGAEKDPPAFYAGVRNLIARAPLRDPDLLEEAKTIGYFGAHFLVTKSSQVEQIVAHQMDAQERLERNKASHFAETAQYMGSKRRLRGFLTEAIRSVADDSTIILDLMCGSGAASAAFAEFWNTYASDAQQFCRNLARIQGAGFSLDRANELIAEVIPQTRRHIGLLEREVGEFLAWENELFHSELGPGLYEPYMELIDSYPTFRSEKVEKNSDLHREIAERRRNSREAPYILFTRYFANIYFGLRQCVEIDSLRFAIDQLDRAEDAAWALGALITACSSVGTTYGGHFAQPKEVTPNNVAQVTEERTHSVIHEFVTRLRNLSRESERAPHPVRVLDGPWHTAIDLLEAEANSGKVVVYLDAPYKREEYGRYYHVLETLVRYGYPDVNGSGRVPSKAPVRGEGIAGTDRFNSGFFTRSAARMNEQLSEIIGQVLDRGWYCAWSYADNAVGQIHEVIDAVAGERECDVRSYSTPWRHTSHRGRAPKEVTEYVILFEPRLSH